VTVEQVDRLDRLAADLGVEIEAAIAEPARLENGVDRQRQLGCIVGELIGAPAAPRRR
jgi:hypothetical protein